MNILKPSLKIIFAGTPTFAAVALQALIESRHTLLAVYTQPDKPAGRGLKLTPSLVKTLALQNNLLVQQPSSLKEKEEQQELAAFHADVMVVAAYGLLLPKSVLTIPRLGCINIHPSLLPRFRGAAPIERTILAGDTMTGVTIMQMDEGLDTGPILYQETLPVDEQETTQTLHDKLAKQGAAALLKTLDLLAQGKAILTPQDEHFATYAHKISKEEAELNFRDDAILFERKVRAFNPKPVAYVIWQGERLRVWQAKALDQSHHFKPGTIISASPVGVDIATGRGVLRLLAVQPAGGKVLLISDFYRGRKQLLKEAQLFA